MIHSHLISRPQLSVPLNACKALSVGWEDANTGDARVQQSMEVHAWLWYISMMCKRYVRCAISVWCVNAGAYQRGIGYVVPIYCCVLFLNLIYQYVKILVIALQHVWVFGKVLQQTGVRYLV